MDVDAIDAGNLPDGVLGIGTSDGLLASLRASAGTGGGRVARFCSCARSLRRASDASDGVVGETGRGLGIAERFADNNGESTASWIPGFLSKKSASSTGPNLAA